MTVSPQDVLAAVEQIINLNLPAESKLRMIKHVLKAAKKPTPA